MSEQWLSYEDFGAIGDGVADDLPAIVRTHEAANAQGAGVRARPDACYHVGRQALTAIIATNTDWNTARFTIDDSDVEDHKQRIFSVESLLQPIDLQIDNLTRDQARLDVQIEQDCYVIAENDARNVYIRRGLNQNIGKPQHDCFIVRRDGSIEGDIDWEYKRISKVEALPIDKETLTISGGVFTTHANRMVQPEGYNYWARNIEIKRSNTVIDNVTHYVVNETDVGHPYLGFLSVVKCADVCLQNCFSTGHKIYKTIGAAGKPVSMGSYDLHANNVVNFHMKSCRMNHILDNTRWGVIGSNFCKNILLEDCTLSRMDTHMGVSGTYIIRNSTLGWMGLNAIGRGDLIIEGSTLYGPTMVSFRGDYGSTWEGDVFIRNSKWVPSAGAECTPTLLGTTNDGMHDFGYPCFMPQRVIIENLEVDDSNTPDDYQGMYILADPDPDAEEQDQERPFPYQACQEIRIGSLTTSSGKNPRVSANAALASSISLS